MKKTILLTIFLVLALFLLSACSSNESSSSEEEVLESEDLDDSDLESPEQNFESFNFKCSDLLTETEFQKFTERTGVVVVTVEEQDDDNLIYCEFSHRSVNNPDNPTADLQLRVYKAGFDGQVTADSIYEKIKKTENELMEISNGPGVKVKEVSGVGLKAFRAVGGNLIVLSSNGEYVLKIGSSTGFVNTVKAESTEEMVALVNSGEVDVAKIFDARLK